MTIEPNDNEIKRTISAMNAGIFKLKKSKRRAFASKEVAKWRKYYTKLRRFINRLRNAQHQNSR